MEVGGWRLEFRLRYCGPLVAVADSTDEFRIIGIRSRRFHESPSIDIRLYCKAAGESRIACERTHVHAPRRIALGLVFQRRLQRLGGLIPLGLVIDLDHMTVGIAEAEGTSAAEIAVGPVDAEPQRAERRGAPLQRLRTGGAPGDAARGTAARTGPRPRLDRRGRSTRTGRRALGPWHRRGSGASLPQASGSRRVGFRQPFPLV